MAFRDLDPEETFLLEGKVFVDVRSPKEFEEFHIPGAVNLPLFENEEKELIGHIYRSRGVEEAFRVGEEIARGKLGEIYSRLRELKEKFGSVVVYCWRGGMRSEAVCSAMARMGLDLYRLRGGYRAYRRFILSDMERILKNTKFVVLTGRTGVGKTAVLRELKGMGVPAIDLEGLAGDRGSVFGGVGIERKVSQKMFDALLYEELRACGGGYIFVEDESRRIGKIILPDPFWERKTEGIYVELEASTETRVENILREYTAVEGWERAVVEAAGKIARYLGPQRYAYLMDLLGGRKYRSAVRFLIEEYYDRKYRRFGDPVVRLSSDDPVACARRLAELYNLLVDEGKVPDTPLQRR